MSMSLSGVRPRLRAVAVATLPIALAVGSVWLPAANAATDPLDVTLTLGPGQSQVVSTVLSSPGVTPVVTCDPGLSVTFDANSVETVHVAPDAGAGIAVCTIDFQIDGQSFGFIQHDTVHVPGLSVGDVTVTEGDTGTVPATFTVSMSEPSPATVTANYATTDGTATAPADYAPVGGTVTFAPGQTSATVTVAVNGDTVDEVDEAFALDLSDGVGAALTVGRGTGTILDQDRNGVFSCRASALVAAGTEPLVADGPGAPCQADQQQTAVSSLNAGLLGVSASGLSAATDQTPEVLVSTAPAAGDTATSTTTVASVTITATLVSIKLNQVTSLAAAECVPTPTGLAPRFAASSSIAGLTINGVPVTVGSGPVDIPLAIGTLHLNGTTTTAGSITQRAVWLHTALTDVVVAQSTAGVHGTVAHPGGNPCTVR